jgi:aromatic-amino-acid transaminase
MVARVEPAQEAPVSNSRLARDSADRPGDDPIFALNAEAERRARAGEHVLNSTLGSLMDESGRLAVMPSVFEAFGRVDPARAAGYAPISGPPAFLAAVVADLLDKSPLAEAAVAAATPGGTGALHHAIVNFLEPGEKLLTTSYYWGPYATLATHTRRSLATFEMFRSGGGLDTAALERALRRLQSEQSRSLVVLNTPCHNPTGYSFDAGDWERVTALLARAAEVAPVTLLLDLAYAKFAGTRSVDWRRAIEPLLGHVTLLFAWTASKAFAQYGARVGACVAVEADRGERERIKNALGFSCRGTWSNCNHLGMLAVTELLTDPALRARADGEREGLRALLQERVRLFNELASRARLDFPRYEGGFFVAVFTPDARRTAEVMSQDGVYVVPLERAVRIAICATPLAEVPRLVQSLERGVRAAGG